MTSTSAAISPNYSGPSTCPVCDGYTERGVAFGGCTCHAEPVEEPRCNGCEKPMWRRISIRTGYCIECRRKDGDDVEDDGDE